MMFEWWPVLVALVLGVVGGALSYRWSMRSKNGWNAEALPPHKLGNRYFRGINYLLNEQPDKALEVFLQLAEVTPETVETHLALGNLFRRRGEMDNAIRCHQNIINQQEISTAERNHAMLELGEDYLRAGLLDRAEELFSVLAENNITTETALQRLLNIFQQEQEWLHAIHAAQQLQRSTGQSAQAMIAQFYCELAVDAFRQQDIKASQKLLEQASETNPECSRVEIIRAEIASSSQQYAAVIAHYQHAVELDPNCLPLVLDDLMQAYHQQHDLDAAATFLQQWLRNHSDTSAVMAQVDIARQQGQFEHAVKLLQAELIRQPTVGKLSALVELNQHPDVNDLELDSKLPMQPMFEQLVAALKQREDGYQCRVCGLIGHTYHWFCPGCRNWETTQPVRGVLGE